MLVASNDPRAVAETQAQIQARGIVKKLSDVLVPIHKMAQHRTGRPREQITQRENSTQAENLTYTEVPVKGGGDFIGRSSSAPWSVESFVLVFEYYSYTNILIGIFLEAKTEISILPLRKDLVYLALFAPNLPDLSLVLL